MQHTPKPYYTEETSSVRVEEVPAGYGHNTSNHVSKPGRMTVDEYFDELWNVYLKKCENLQG